MDELKQLRDIFSRNAERTLFVDARDQEEMTYGQFLENSLKLARFLREKGLGPGDPVVFSMDNCLELAALYLACMHLGALIVPINPALHPNDFRRILESNRPGMAFIAPDVRARVDEVFQEQASVEVICLEAKVDPAGQKARDLINFDFDRELDRLAPLDSPFALADEASVLIRTYTSGTTSSPKGVDILYGGLLGNGLAFRRRLGLGRDSRFYNVLPMTYLGGFYNLMLIPILTEGSVVLDAPLGGASLYGFWANVEDFKINTLWFTATMLSLLMSLPDDEDLSFLRNQVKIGLCGMAPLPVEIKKRFEQRFGFNLYENYALSETTFLTTNYPGLPYKDGSSGPPLDGVTVEIVDRERRPLPTGREGEIRIRTPYLMKGYSGAADSDEANLTEDGFLTGDLGYLNEGGELFVTGRIKDVIIRGGINISPLGIEEILYEHEAVEETAVLGLPHPIYGEEVAAVVKVRPAFKDQVTDEDLKALVAERIAHFQRPKQIYFIDEMPKGVTGKINKNLLRRLLVEKTDPLSG